MGIRQSSAQSRLQDLRTCEAMELLLRAQSASGVLLPEKVPVREKRALTTHQIPCLLELLKEPARTTVLLAILTGMQVGGDSRPAAEVRRFLSGQVRIEQVNYRDIFGTPKTKGGKRSLPIPKHSPLRSRV